MLPWVVFCPATVTHIAGGVRTIEPVIEPRALGSTRAITAATVFIVTTANTATLTWCRRFSVVTPLQPCGGLPDSSLCDTCRKARIRTRARSFNRSTAPASAMTRRTGLLNPGCTLNLDRIAVTMIALVIPLGVFVTSGSYWLLLTVSLGCLYAWKTDQPDLAWVMVLAPALELTRNSVLLAITRLTPHPIDASLLRMDGGLDVRFWQWCLSHPAIEQSLHFIYRRLVMAIFLTLIFTHQRRELVRTLLTSTALGVGCYLLFPAVGPAWVNIPDAPRNCMPSLHVAWAILLAIYAPKWMRWPMALFAALTAVATVGIGEHYVIDLVAAVPFTWAIVGLGRNPARALAQRPTVLAISNPNRHAGLPGTEAQEAALAVAAPYSKVTI